PRCRCTSSTRPTFCCPRATFFKVDRGQVLAAMIGYGCSEMPGCTRSRAAARPGRKKRSELMSDMPKKVGLHEQGPREGFQIEPGPISSADKIALIDALSETGLRHIQVCSFVNPRVVPNWADAETVAGGFRVNPDVEYTALWFNKSGLNRALAFRVRLTMHGSISLSASDAFSRKNLIRSHEENLQAMRLQSEAHIGVGIPVKKIGVMAAFGCDYQGDVPAAEVVRTLEGGMAVAGDVGAEI